MLRAILVDGCTGENWKASQNIDPYNHVGRSKSKGISRSAYLATKKSWASYVVG